jgi:ketosteroid isomerase-like protein
MSAMGELDDFLNQILARQVKADEALHNGDPEPRLAMWSTQDPVTVLGAMKDVIGAQEARQAFGWLGTHFSDCTAFRFELVAAGVSGDLAYTVGYEHTSASGTASRSSRIPCGSPTPTAASRASGRSSTATPTGPRSIRPLPPRHRPGRRHGRGVQRRTGQSPPARQRNTQDPVGRPIAAPLEQCAELLGVDLATVRELAANIEPYLRADGTRIWSLMQLERQLRPQAYGRRRGGYLDRRRSSSADT